MMPLTLASPEEEYIIKKIGGKPEVKKHLENLGFVVGGNVTVITELAGNVIVNVGSPRCDKPRNGAENNDLKNPAINFGGEYI